MIVSLLTSPRPDISISMVMLIGREQRIPLSLPMLGERYRTTDSHPISSGAILERRQVQNDCLPTAELNALNVASGRAGAISLGKLTANKHLVGISVQQLKGSTRRSIRRFHI